MDTPARLRSGTTPELRPSRTNVQTSLKGPFKGPQQNNVFVRSRPIKNSRLPSPRPEKRTGRGEGLGVRGKRVALVTRDLRSDQFPRSIFDIFAIFDIFDFQTRHPA